MSPFYHNPDLLCRRYLDRFSEIIADENERRAVAEEQRNAPADDCDREDHTCGGIAQVAHAVAHKNLVNNAIQVGNNGEKIQGTANFSSSFPGISLPR